MPLLLPLDDLLPDEDWLVLLREDDDLARRVVVVVIHDDGCREGTSDGINDGISDGTSLGISEEPSINNNNRLERGRLRLDKLSSASVLLLNSTSATRTSVAAGRTEDDNCMMDG